MKVYLLWRWWEDEEPTVVAVTDSKEKAEEFMEEIKLQIDDDDYEYSIDERELNTTTYDL